MVSPTEIPSHFWSSLPRSIPNSNLFGVKFLVDFFNFSIQENAPHWYISDLTDFELSGNFGALHERCPVLSTNQVQHICFFPFDPFHLRRREPLYLFVVVVLVCYGLCHFPFCESGRSEKNVCLTTNNILRKNKTFSIPLTLTVTFNNTMKIYYSLKLVWKFWGHPENRIFRTET